MSEEAIIREILPYAVGITGGLAFVAIKFAVKWTFKKVFT